MRHLLSFAVFCATLQLVASKTTNGYDCTNNCDKWTGYEGTICNVAHASITGVLNNYYNCPPNAQGGGYVTSCYDYCGYTYQKTTGCGSCTGTSATSCGLSSGTCPENYKCVDSKGNDGNHCPQSPQAPATTTSCEAKACPPPSCSSAVCAAGGSGSSRGIQCRGGIDLDIFVGLYGLSCMSTIKQGCINPCDCGSCSTSSTSSGKHFSSSVLFFCLQFMASTPDARPSDKFAVCPGRYTKFSLPFFVE